MANTDAVFIPTNPVPPATVIKFTNLVIIDESGSMCKKASDVIGGLKKIFADIKADAVKDTNVVTTTIVIAFSMPNSIRVLVNSTDPNDLTDSIADAYNPNSGTALFDAIGKGFSLIPEGQDGVYVTIITDGLENESKEYTLETVKTLITDARKKEWAVIFMGTTEDAIESAVSFGVSTGNTYRFADTSRGMQTVNKMSSNIRHTYYANTVTLCSTGDTATSVNLDSLVTDELKNDTTEEPEK